MAIFNSYVSLPEGTSGDISDGKISTPKPKNVICFEGWTNVLLVKKNKYLHSAGGTSRFFQEEHPHFRVNNGDFSIASGWYTTVSVSRSIPCLYTPVASIFVF